MSWEWNCAGKLLWTTQIVPPSYFYTYYTKNRDIRETVTFLDPGFHEMKHEKIDGGVKDRKKTWYNTMWVDKITNALEEVLGVEWMVAA